MAVFEKSGWHYVEELAIGPGERLCGRLMLARFTYGLLRYWGAETASLLRN